MSVEQERGAGYDLSLRIWHPDLEPDLISRELGLDMTAGWAVGTPRYTVTGESLAPHESTYWTSRFRSGSEGDLTTYVRELCIYLEPRLPFLREIQATNGRVEFFVGWFVDSHSGTTLGHADLAVLSRMGVDLALDVYGAAPATMSS
jgi:hypothetical protein